MPAVLTFHKKMAPYESSWLVMLKALLVNDISLNDLMNLVLKTDAPRNGSKIYWLESHQFNVSKISHTLSIPLPAVENSFIDILMGSNRPIGPATVRHCRVCIQHLFHSALFQLSWVTHCPIHDAPLVECKNCTSFLRDNSLIKIRNAERGGRCNHLAPFRKQKYPISLLSDIEIDQYTVWARSVVEWLSRAAMVMPGEFARVVSVPLKHWDVKLRFVFWRYLESRVGLAPISIPEVNYEAARAALDLPHKIPDDGELEYRSSLISGIKSVRRHICRHFLRRHRSCISIVRSLTLNQCNALLSDRRCSCSLAYYCWLVRVFNIYTMRDLRNPRLDPYAEHRRSCPEPRVRDLPGYLLEIWLAFFDIWAGIEIYDAESSDSFEAAILIRANRQFDLIHPNFSLQTRHVDSGQLKNHYFVKADFLLNQSLARCKCRGNGSMIMDYVVADDVGIPNVPRETLFVLRCHAWHHVRQRRYIYV